MVAYYWNLRMKTVCCITLTLLLFLPPLLGFFLLNFLPKESFLVINIEESQDIVTAKVVTAFDSFETSEVGNTIVSFAGSCNDVNAPVIVTNTTDCSAHPDIFIYVDEHNEEEWRVSSHRRYPMKHKYFPVVLIRNKDLDFLQGNMIENLQEGKVLVMRNKDNWIDDVERVVECSTDPVIHVEFGLEL